MARKSGGRLTGEDMVIDALIVLSEALGHMLGEHFEVVVHNLRCPEHSIVAIVNGHISNRAVGSPLIGGPNSDCGFDILLEDSSIDYLCNYPMTTRDGKPLKSGTVVFRNRQGKPFASMCLNYDLTSVLVAKRLIDDFCNRTQASVEDTNRPGDSAGPRVDVYEVLQSIVEQVIHCAPKPVPLMEKADRVQAILEMRRRGVFTIKGAVDCAAKALGVSRYTIYNYLEEVKGRTGAGGGQDRP